MIKNIVISSLTAMMLTFSPNIFAQGCKCGDKCECSSCDCSSCDGCDHCG